MARRFSPAFYHRQELLCTLEKRLREKFSQSDDHFDRVFLFMAMKGESYEPRKKNQQERRKETKP
jgi:hypothetical protein